MIFDRMAPMYGQDMARPYGRDTMRNGGINPGGMYTGGNMRPQVGQFPTTGGPAQHFQMPQQDPWMTGGPGQQFRMPQFQTGGNAPPSSLGQWFNTYRRSAYG